MGRRRDSGLSEDSIDPNRGIWGSPSVDGARYRRAPGRRGGSPSPAALAERIFRAAVLSQVLHSRTGPLSISSLRGGGGEEERDRDRRDRHARIAPSVDRVPDRSGAKRNKIKGRPFARLLRAADRSGPPTRLERLQVPPFEPQPIILSSIQRSDFFKIYLTKHLYPGPLSGRIYPYG